ncbi:hypothetical protein [uncultured Rummeliibacillus sp.]|uniref:hypothetical protein n=1 Tax=uncultured Rummeliibacillus sp. TaxID=762292 RepID=UPI00261B6AD1|nr:hypothetical protein [uncultured Rummeliibacillus sp.]
MGIFDFLKNGRKEYKKSEKTVPKKFTSQELISAKFIIEQKQTVINDSLKIIKTTKNVDTFFSRYNLLINSLTEIIETIDIYKAYLSMNNNSVQNLYNDLVINKSSYIDSLIQRSSSQLIEKVDSLSTDKSILNHINKFKESLFAFTNELNEGQIRKINNIVVSLTPTDHLKNELETTVENELPISVTNISPFDEADIYKRWNISISFGKSTSKNFSKALYLAKNSDRYVEDADDQGNSVYQAFFIEKNFLEFMRLYKLIGNWKSTFVFINGEIIDNKSLGKINICYGDKLKFNDPNFCFGASEWTSNPFGCHRLMLTPSQTPWWSFGEFNVLGDWIINKEEIIEKIKYKAKLFEKCPAFDIERVLKVVELLPDKISRKKDKEKWYFNDSGVMPLDSMKINKNVIKLLK